MTTLLQPQRPPPANDGHVRDSLTADERLLRKAVARCLKAQVAEVHGRLVGGMEVKGGPGSGNFGHEGRPGEVGGSGPGGGGGGGGERKVTTGLSTLSDKEIFEIGYPLDSKARSMILDEVILRLPNGTYAINRDRGSRGSLREAVSRFINYDIPVSDVERAVRGLSTIHPEAVYANLTLGLDEVIMTNRQEETKSLKSRSPTSAVPSSTKPWDDMVMREVRPIWFGLFKKGGDKALQNIRRFPKHARKMAVLSWAEMEASERVEFMGASADLLRTLERGELTPAPAHFKGGPGSGNFGHEGRPGEVGGSGPGSGEGGDGSFGQPNGEHTPEGQRRVISYLEKETGFKFTPYGSVAGGTTSKNDWDISVVPLTEKEEEEANFAWLHEQATMYEKLQQGKITPEEYGEFVEGSASDPYGIRLALGKVGYKEEGTAQWLGVASIRFHNDKTGHSIEIWTPSDVGYSDMRYTPVDKSLKSRSPAERMEVVQKGGPGSGNFGHVGRPGEVGGSGGSSYHGTYGEVINDIRNDGIKPGIGGKVFLSTQMKEALDWGRIRARKNNDPIIAVVEVNEDFIHLEKVSYGEDHYRVAERIPSDKIKSITLYKTDDVENWLYHSGPKPNPVKEKSTSKNSLFVFTLSEKQTKSLKATPSIVIPEWIEDPDVLDALENEMFKFAHGINQTTADALRDELMAGMENGETIDQLADRISGLSDEWVEGWRSEMIARTETARAFSTGHIEAWRSTGVVDRKVWVAAGDACPFCQQMDGTVVDLDENFFDQGDEQTTDWKGQEVVMGHDYNDVNGPPLHPNCRCVLAGMLTGEEESE